MLSRWVQTTWRAEASGVGAGGFRGRVLPCLKRPWVHAVLLYLLTFGVVLPLLCQGLRQSRPPPTATICRRASVMLSWAVLALYTMLVVELAGRHYLLEWRRLSPQLYSLMPATECCTPAMLFSAPAARRVLAYLGSVRCRAGYAKDTALYALLREHGETAYALEPNLVTHIGLYSTLRGPEDQSPLEDRKMIWRSNQTQQRAGSQRQEAPRDV
ncbi:uncharacterized protein LOC132206703 [Stegostoma tigrinum]|uniref:uncharacterized protein LOC132206703 n=1 Tax=Stegostoma tigrinum TaxID=3053191 RepID=UPI002870756D|nr:uncharacterized protein LOC132206703 [Stegostoma tigrinum]